jgi:hypothetical protein
MSRDWTYHDAGIRSPLLRALNALGGTLRPGRPRFEPDALIREATEKAKLDDFGDPSFREGLEALCEGIERDARLTTFGRMTLRGMLEGQLVTRLRAMEWARTHPEVDEERIHRPFVVLGLPRTGTTLLSFLMELDPRSRALRTWEAMDPIPPPGLASQAEDSRIPQAIRRHEQLAKLIPPMPAMHPAGATLPTECVTLLALDFKSLLFDTQMHSPSYGRFLEKADLRPTYALHERMLQILQSTIPTTSWSLKTPQHLWSIPQLRERYPDARLVWTHRDPARVVPSVVSLNMAFYRTMSRVEVSEVAPEWEHKLFYGLSQGMAYDAEAEQGWCAHVLYENLLDDPIATVRGIYAHHGDELDPLHERRMQVWMRDRPQNHYGRHRYDMEEFGFTPEGLDERFGPYREQFGVPRETRS